MLLKPKTLFYSISFKYLQESVRKILMKDFSSEDSKDEIIRR